MTEICDNKEIEKEIEKFWGRFIKKNPHYRGKKYEVWSFGFGVHQADTLLALVREGSKTATSSAEQMYDEGEKKPEKGDISIITYGNGLPGCIIQTTEVKYRRFTEITEEEAALEGEGDLSLNFWRKVHKEAFAREYEEKGMKFHSEIPVIFEKFKVIYDESHTEKYSTNR